MYLNSCPNHQSVGYPAVVVVFVSSAIGVQFFYDTFIILLGANTGTQILPPIDQAQGQI